MMLLNSGPRKMLPHNGHCTQKSLPKIDDAIEAWSKEDVASQ